MGPGMLGCIFAKYFANLVYPASGNPITTWFDWCSAICYEG